MQGYLSHEYVEISALLARGGCFKAGVKAAFRGKCQMSLICCFRN